MEIFLKVWSLWRGTSAEPLTSQRLLGKRNLEALRSWEVSENWQGYLQHNCLGCPILVILDMVVYPRGVFRVLWSRFQSKFYSAEIFPCEIPSHSWEQGMGKWKPTLLIIFSFRWYIICVNGTNFFQSYKQKCMLKWRNWQPCWMKKTLSHGWKVLTHDEAINYGTGCLHFGIHWLSLLDEDSQLMSSIWSHGTFWGYKSKCFGWELYFCPWNSHKLNRNLCHVGEAWIQCWGPEFPLVTLYLGCVSN